jgi:hypothetical protein
MFCLPKANLIIASRRPRYFLNESVKSGDSQVLVEPKLSRQGRYSGGRSTYYYSGPARNIFFTTFSRQFRILNCNLSDSLKNLPTLFQKWFEYFHQQGV